MTTDILIILGVLWYGLCGTAIWLGVNQGRQAQNRQESIIREFLLCVVVLFWLPIFAIGAPFYVLRRVTR